MTFLTTLELNPRREGAQRLMTSRQAMHAAVLAAFGAATAAQQRPLWRVDVNGEQVKLLVLSSTRPDLTHVVEQAGRPTTDTWSTLDYDPVLDALTDGSAHGFRLVANPTTSVPSPRFRDASATSKERRGKQIPLTTTDQQIAWLAARGERIGVSFVDPTTGEQNFLVRRAVAAQWQRTDRSTGKRGTVTVQLATFEGNLLVTDAAALRAAITTGIGPARAYGAGLLTLARPVVR